MSGDEVIDVRRDAVTVDREAGETVMTRSRLRHELHRLIVGRRQRQVRPDVPSVLVMYPSTHDDLRLEGPSHGGLDEMPLPRQIGDQSTFRSIPILLAENQPEHVVEVRWT